ncbi:MAG: hypothetical protein WBH57_01665, partial [Anaerolineae bacterium]
RAPNCATGPRSVHSGGITVASGSDYFYVSPLRLPGEFGLTALPPQRLCQVPTTPGSLGGMAYYSCSRPFS